MITKDRTIKLIEGVFTFEEAAEILFSLLMHKIKFHNLQLLHGQALNEENRKRSEERIHALKESKNIITEMILTARDKGYELQIDSSIDIKFVKIKR